MPRYLQATTERFPVAGSFTISRGTRTHADVVTCTIRDGSFTGIGECVPYPRYGESIEGVIADIEADAPVIADETFGPIIAIRTFTAPTDAIAEVNASPFGLQAGIFTNDHAAIKQFSRDLIVGGVMINEGPDFRAEHVPFGGIKSSGLGREGVRIAVREMSETKVVID